ncbi:MAG TPA: hypothetical protein GX693_04130 [Firmicutes bacterium]|nr:hypothetical protein [Bacillota bacterium]
MLLEKEMGIIINTGEPEKDFEYLINQVQGVISSRVVRQGQEIIEIHVLTDTSRAPKQLVRDIESTLLVKLGQQIDYRRISIAQLGDDQKRLLEGPRLKLLEISSTSSRNKMVVTITIGLGNEKFKAAISGPNIANNRLTLASKATLAAVEKCYGISSRLEINQVEKVQLSGLEAILAAVSLILESKEEVLLGTALVKGDDQKAAAKAALDAINRRLLKIDHVKD